jgi:hypothetical protein
MSKQVDDFAMWQALAVDTLDDNVWPIGHVGTNLGRHPRELVQAALELKMKPRIWINGIPYFSIRQIEIFEAHFSPGKPTPEPAPAPAKTPINVQ